MNTPAGVVVVAGGAGQAGRWVVREVVRHGWSAVVTTRSEGGRARLGHFLDAYAVPPHQVDIVVGCLEDLATSAVLESHVLARELPVVGAVASLGGWYLGPDLLELPLARWRKTIEDNLTSHFVAARTLVPLLLRHAGQSPAYVTLNGIAGVAPCPGSGAISAAGAAQSMLLDVLRAEDAERRIRWREVSVLGPIEPALRDEPPATSPPVSGAVVATAVVEAIGSPGGPDRVTVEPS